MASYRPVEFGESKLGLTGRIADNLSLALVIASEPFVDFADAIRYYAGPTFGRYFNNVFERIPGGIQ
jgi:hypothetical protein